MKNLLLSALLLLATHTAISPATPETKAEPHLRECRVLRVIDGDTAECLIIFAQKAEVGFEISITTSCRLWGINAPDAKPDGKEKADAATAYLKKLIAELPDGACQCELRGRDKYGRCLLRILANGVDLNQKMLDAGHAVVYLP